MAHTGSFVPADEALVGLTDRIFTRITTHESACAAVAQSAFMHDTHQMALMLRHSTPRSLLVVDECAARCDRRVRMQAEVFLLADAFATAL